MGGQCGCEQNSEAFVKIQKTIVCVGGWVGSGGVGLGGQGGCERRSGVFVKIKKKNIFFFFFFFFF